MSLYISIIILLPPLFLLAIQYFRHNRFITSNTLYKALLQLQLGKNHDAAESFAYLYNKMKRPPWERFKQRICAMIDQYDIGANHEPVEKFLDILRGEIEDE